MKLILSTLAISMTISHAIIGQLGGLTDISSNSTEFQTVINYISSFDNIITSSLQQSGVTLNYGCITHYQLDSVQKQTVNGLNYFVSVQLLCDPAANYAQLYIYKPFTKSPILVAMNYPTQLTDTLTSFTQGNLPLYNTTDTVGGDTDAHNCYTNAGYSWCEATNTCYRWWEDDCTSAVIGGDRDSYGCVISAGYEWCAATNKCYREWEESCTIGGDTDAHGCVISAGYIYCVQTGTCLRPWETSCNFSIIITGNDRDSDGCIVSAGYSWCEVKNQCYRQWEEECVSSDMSSTVGETKVTESEEVDEDEGFSEEKSSAGLGIEIAVVVLTVIIAVGVIAMMIYCIKHKEYYKKDRKMLSHTDASVSYEQL